MSPINRIPTYPVPDGSDSYPQRLITALQNEAHLRVVDFDILKVSNVPWVDVREYGAKPEDSTHDDTVSIQAAADSLTTGGIVFLPEGDYLISGSGNECVRFDYSVKMLGASMRDTIIKLADSQTVSTMIRTYATNNLSYIQFENLTLDGNKANQSGTQIQNGLYLDNVQNGIVRNVYVKDVYSNNPPTTEAGGINVVDSYDVVLDSCIVRAIDGFGIYYGNVSQQFIRGMVNNCVATECVSVGINAWNIRNLLVTGSHAYNNTNSGLMFEDSNNISVVGCSAYLNGGHGIWINETNGSIVMGCLSYNNDGNGITVSGTSGYVANDNIFIGNRCDDTRTGEAESQDYGIYEGAYATGNMVIGNNTIGNVNAPIYLSGGSSRCFHNITDESVLLASASTITLPNTRDFIRITGTTNITSVTASWEGRRVVLKFADVLTFTDGSNLKLAGNFVTSADDTITLVSDGTNWYEESRSAN